MKSVLLMEVEVHEKLQWIAPEAYDASLTLHFPDQQLPASGV